MQCTQFDFVMQDETDIIPFEVKAGGNVASASFKEYMNKYHPVKAVRFSTLGMQQNDGFVNLPLYLAGRMRELI